MLNRKLPKKSTNSIWDIVFPVIILVAITLAVLIIFVIWHFIAKFW